MELIWRSVSKDSPTRILDSVFPSGDRAMFSGMGMSLCTVISGAVFMFHFLPPCIRMPLVSTIIFKKSFSDGAQDLESYLWDDGVTEASKSVHTVGSSCCDA